MHCIHVSQSYVSIAFDRLQRSTTSSAADRGRSSALLSLHSNQKFCELDADGNGQITVKELSKKMHKEAPKEDIEQLHKVSEVC